MATDRVFEDLATDLQYVTRRIARWSELGPTLAPIVAKAETLANAVPRMSSTTLDIAIAGATGELIGFVAFLEELGYRLRTPLPETAVQYWSSFVENAEGESMLYLSWTNTVCHRVQIGVRVEEVPVYDIRCGEQHEENSNE